MCKCHSNAHIDLHLIHVGGGGGGGEHLPMVRWVFGLILHGTPIELFLIPASALQLLNKCRGMSYPLWDGAYKKSLANQKEYSMMWQQHISFLSHHHGSLPHVRCHITIKNVHR